MSDAPRESALRLGSYCLCLIGSILLTLQKTLGITGGNNTKTKDEDQNPEQVRFTLIHRRMPP